MIERKRKAAPQAAPVATLFAELMQAGSADSVKDRAAAAKRAGDMLEAGATIGADERAALAFVLRGGFKRKRGKPESLAIAARDHFLREQFEQLRLSLSREEAIAELAQRHGMEWETVRSALFPPAGSLKRITVRKRSG